MRMIIQSSLPTYNKVRRSRDSQYELISKHAGYEYDEHYDWTPFDTKGRSGSNLTWYIEIVEGPQTATPNYGIAVFNAGVAPTSSLPISTSTITSTLLNTLGQVIATSPGHSASATQSRPTSQASATTQPALHNSASSLGYGEHGSDIFEWHLRLVCSGLSCEPLHKKGAAATRQKPSGGSRITTGHNEGALHFFDDHTIIGGPAEHCTLFRAISIILSSRSGGP